VERQQLSGPNCAPVSQEARPLFPGYASYAKHFCCFLREHTREREKGASYPSQGVGMKKGSQL